MKNAPIEDQRYFDGFKDGMRNLRETILLIELEGGQCEVINALLRCELKKMSKGIFKEVKNEYKRINK